ncbi:hypothetical protein L873DRAFT_1804380 [Choiromyces venosus 120613-1]|uniref:Uncharacterized protein n=1 Tax=Choiromyces venosus 120613-1 TaxID=1336337 RepID=A0A3N4JV08_9PEZI|nr:hypothetical protein L873DRAFT_1804380 [Choiromyces venosus 120613-1]
MSLPPLPSVGVSRPSAGLLPCIGVPRPEGFGTVVDREDKPVPNHLWDHIRVLDNHISEFGKVQPIPTITL